MSASAIRLSKKTEYALRALLHMATAPVGRVHSLHDLCASENLPVKFVEQALGSLKNAGILASRRGSRGGYVLMRPPDRIRIGEVLGPVGGNSDHYGSRSGDSHPEPQGIGNAAPAGWQRS